MDRIVLVPKCQYGYNTDYYQMANRLSVKGLEVDLICYDFGHPRKKAPPGVNIIYVPRGAKKAGNYSRFMAVTARHIFKYQHSIHWVLISGTLEFSGIIPLFFKMFNTKMKWILDIRTCSVVEDEKKRQKDDRLLALSARQFHHVSIISEHVAERLGIRNYEVLPLGADCYVDLSLKQFDSENINFLYVGTFDNRRIEDTIEAFDRLCSNRAEKFISYDIVGFSDNPETRLNFEKTLQATKNRGRIHFHGRKLHDEIIPLFQKANIGISYIPKTEYFDKQPPTKSYEYIMNGIICMGTSTGANKDIVNPKNGVLTEDNVDGLYEGMLQVVDNIENYDVGEVAGTVSKNDWENIANNFFVFLQRIDKKSQSKLHERLMEKV